MKILIILFFYIISVFNCAGQTDKEFINATYDSKTSDTLLVHKIISNDSFNLLSISQGCFGWSFDSIIIKRVDTIITMTLYENNTLNEMVRTYKIQLINSDLATIEQIFYRGLRLKEEGGCTTVTTYSIISSDDKIQFVSDNCDFHFYSDWKFELGKRRRLK